MRRRDYTFPAKVKILVSENNIVNGISGDPEGCAIWQAVMVDGEGFKQKPDRCRIMGGRLSLKIGGRRAYYSFSRNGSGFQAAFDQKEGGVVSPGVVVVNRIGESAKINETALKLRERVNRARTAMIARGKSVKQNGGGRTFSAVDG